eukprot:scaffold81269_cov36-Tisochrysis_lutea.AAC.1
MATAPPQLSQPLTWLGVNNNPKAQLATMHILCKDRVALVLAVLFKTVQTYNVAQRVNRLTVRSTLLM